MNEELTSMIKHDNDDPANIRASASTNSEIIGQIPAGTAITFKRGDKSGQWFKVTYNGKTGYVSANAIVLARKVDKETTARLSNPKASEPKGNPGNGNVSSTGSNSKSIGSGNQTLSRILSDNDPGWKPEFYTDHKNYSEFMEQDSLGSWSPKPNGKYTKLTNAGDLLYENRNKSNKNEYWKNLENAYGVDTEAIVNKMYNTAHTQEQWHNLRNKYLTGKAKDKSLFSGELQNLHMAMYGHGDTPDDGTEALEKALGNNVSDLGGIAKIMGVLTGNDTYDATASSEGIPPLDTDITDTSEDSGGQTIVNKYSIMSNSKAQDARLNAILRNTYDVRDEQVAALLRKILKKLEETKKDDNPRTGGSSPNLFNDDRIPQAVQRLSKG
jgi:hypothetical protein